MKLPKLPAWMLYVGDWKKDPGLQSLDVIERCALFEILLIMHESESPGKLMVGGKPVPLDRLARMTRMELADIERALPALIELGVFSICEETGCPMNRRMVADHEARLIRTANGKKGGNPAFKKGHANPYYAKTSNIPPQTGPELLEDITNTITGDITEVISGLSSGDNQNISLSSSTSSSDSSSTSDSKMMSSTSSGDIPPTLKEEGIVGDPVVMKFPSGEGDWDLHQSKIKEWEESHPTIDVVKECRKARQWLLDNPDQPKTLRGMSRYIGNWLNKSEVIAARSGGPFQSSPVIKNMDVVVSTPSSNEPYDPKTAPVPFNSPEFRRSWVRWVEYSVEIGKPVNRHLIEATAEDAVRLGEQNFILTVQNSVGKGYRSLVPPEGIAPEKKDKPKPAGPIDDLLLSWQLEKYGSKSGNLNLLPEDQPKQESTQEGQS